jgi:hypothetical protein
VQKIISNALEANRINNEHHLKRAATIAPLKGLIAPVAASTDQAVEEVPGI